MLAKTRSQVNGEQITKGGFKTKRAAQEEVARVTNDLANGDYENSDIRFSRLVRNLDEEKRSSCSDTSNIYQYKRIYLITCHA